jgi:hypothetical protein
MKRTRNILTLVLTCFAFFASLPVYSQDKEEVLKEDVLVFRVQTRLVFLSDLKSYLSHLKDFHCLFPEANLLKMADISFDKVAEVQGLTVGEVQQSPVLIKKVMRLVLTQVYTNSLSLSLERDFDLGLPLKKCGLGRFGSWNNELKSLVQAELYMRLGNERPPEYTIEARQRYYQILDDKMDYEFNL